MYNLKQTPFIVLMLSLFLFVGCTSEEVVIEPGQNLEKSNSSSNFIYLEDIDELPELTPLLDFLPDIQYDNERVSIIDTENSILTVPIVVNLNEMKYFEWPIIKIARKKPKPGCKSCVDCIGFRCKPNKPTNPSVILSDLEKFNDIMLNKFSTNELSLNREEDFIVKVDFENQNLEFHSYSLIDWYNLR